MQLIKLIFAVGYPLIAISIEKSLALEWVTEDAVYLTGIHSRNTPDETDADLRPPGKCIRFRECYPIFFLTDDRIDQDHLTSINSDLIDFVLESTDICTPEVDNGLFGDFANNDSIAVPPGERFVWCKLGSVNNNREKPAIIGLKAVNDESCGKSISTTEEESFSLPSSQFLDIEYPAGKVVGGTELKPGDAPYAAVMTFRGKQVCGASIIDEYHILTAAHCVSHLRPTALHSLKIFIGEHNINDPSDTMHQERNVSKVIYHKEFSSDTLHDDIAMIKVSEPIMYTKNSGPVCLSDGSQSYEDGSTMGKLVGWGQLSDEGERSFTPRSANLRIWKSEDCEEIYGDKVPEENFETAFCAGGFQDGGTADACRGDSGGPLTITHNNRIEQVGIVSFGIGCGRYPGVFTKVESYRSWIDRHRTLIFESE